MHLLTPEYALELWRTAAAAEHGITLTVAAEDLECITNLLYAARAEAADPSLQSITLRKMAGGREIWLFRKPTTAPLED